MIDPTTGELEVMFSQGRQKFDNSIHEKISENYPQGKPAIDRTNTMLKRLQMQTPCLDINQNKIRRI